MTTGDDEKLKQLRLETQAEVIQASEHDQPIAEYSDDQLEELVNNFDASAQVVALEEGSGLSQEDIEEVRADFDLKKRLSDIALDVRSAVDEYKLKIASVLGKYNRFAERKAVTLQFKQIERNVREIAETDIVQAAIELDKAPNDWRVKELSRSLRDELKGKVTVKLEEAYAQGLDTALSLYDKLQPTTMGDLAESELIGFVYKQVNKGDASRNALKEQLVSYPALALRMRKHLDRDQQIFQVSDLPRLMLEAAAKGDDNTLGEYVKEIHYHQWYKEYKDLYDYPEVASIVFNYLLRNRKFTELAQRFDLYKEVFETLSTDQQQSIAEEVFARESRLAYVFKDKVQFSSDEKEAIIKDLREHNGYKEILEPNAIKQLDVSDHDKLRAIYDYTKREPYDLLMFGIEKYQLDLSRNEKRTLLSELIKEAGHHGGRVEASLMTSETISLLEIQPADLIKIFELFSKDKYGGSASDKQYDQRFNKLGERQQRLLFQRLVKQAHLHPKVEQLFLNKSEADFSEAVGMLGQFYDFQIAKSSLLVHLDEDPLLLKFRYGADERSLKLLEDLAQDLPEFFEDPELLKYVSNRDWQYWENLKKHSEVIKSLPSEFKTPSVINLVCEYPENVADIVQMLTEKPVLYKRPEVLRAMASNFEHKDFLLEIFEQNQDLNDEVLSQLLIISPGREEYVKEMSVIAHKAPEIFNYFRNLDNILPNYKNFEPLIDRYDEIREFFYVTSSQKVRTNNFDPRLVWYIAEHPDNVNKAIDLIKLIPDKKYHKVVMEHLDRFVQKPELLNELSEVAEFAPWLLRSDYATASVQAFLDNPDLFKPLFKKENIEKDWIWGIEPMLAIAQQPELLLRYAALVDKLPSDMPSYIFGSNRLNEILSDPVKEEMLVTFGKLSPHVVLNYSEFVIVKLVTNAHTLRGLIEDEDFKTTTTKQILLLNPAGVRYLSYNPSAIPKYRELVAEFPDSLGSSIFSKNFESWLDIPKEKRAQYFEVFAQIINSPSQEIQRLKDSLLSQIVETKDPVAAYRKIESVFVKNNLPTVGKVYKIFEILYPTNVLESKLKKHSSPVLLRAGARRRNYIIYKDLLNVHIKSGNRSLRQYIEVFQSGENILAKLEASNVESLDETEKKQLNYFLNKLDTLFANSALGGTNDSLSYESGSLTERVEMLKSSLGLKEGQTFNERIAEMFVKPLGLKNLNDILRLMQTEKLRAHRRGVDSVRQSSDGHLALEEGDLLKGVNAEHISTILQNGSVAKEFLGASSDSDATPFDTDVGRLSQQEENKDFNQIIKGNIAIGYDGGLLFAIRNRGQFVETSRDQEQPDKGDSRLELFKAGTQGGDHYGIRTGFPSTEIDFIIANDGFLREPKSLQELYYEIAQNGYYIPVTDQTGNVIFSPEMYEVLRKSFAGLDRFDGDPLEVSRINPGNQFYEAMQGIIATIDNNERGISAISAKISHSLQAILQDFGVSLKDKFDTSLLGAELWDTGSTGRRTNTASDYDFDLSLKLDAMDFEKATQMAEAFKKRLTFVKDNSHIEGGGYYQLRIAGVSAIDGVVLDQPIDIDVGFSKKSDLFVYSSHEAVEERLMSIKNREGDEVYKEVLANIILAKKILKENKAYKKQEDGGFGGIGVENWILSNGGSVEKAFQSFRNAAYEDGIPVSLDKFKQRYKIYDPGFNIKYNNHDNYIELLKPDGYEAMLKAIQ